MPVTPSTAVALFAALRAARPDAIGDVVVEVLTRETG